MITEKGKFVNKKWGYEIWIVNNEYYCGKMLVLKKGAQCSLHYHPKKRETFCVLEGKIRLNVNSEKYTMSSTSDPITIEPNEPHMFYGIQRSEILEVSTPHSDDDVVRMSESQCPV